MSSCLHRSFMQLVKGTDTLSKSRVLRSEKKILPRESRREMEGMERGDDEGKG